MPHRAQLPLRQRRDVRAVEHDAPGGRLDQPDQGPGDRGLAAAGLADDGQACRRARRRTTLVDGAEGIRRRGYSTTRSGRQEVRQASGAVMAAHGGASVGGRELAPRCDDRSRAARDGLAVGGGPVARVGPSAQLGDRREQVRVYSVCGWSTTSSTSPLSTKRPRLHDVDPVAHEPGDPQVVRDQQHGDAGALLQLEQQVEDAGLDGDVECAGRLVGDDAVRVSAASAIAMRTRCSMPPESWCGYLLELLARASRMCTCSAARARRRAPAPWSAPCGVCAPPRPSGCRWCAIGLSAVIGSCGISATARPRTCSMSLRLPMTSWPSMRRARTITARSSGSSRRMPIAVVDLPEPDSPMMVTVSPASMWKLTPSTARMTPRVGHQLDLQVVGPRSRRAHGLCARLRAAGAVAQAVADEVDADDEQRDDQTGQGDQPPRAGDE